MNRFFEIFFVIWSWLSALCLVGAVAAILGFLCVKGFPALNVELIFGNTEPLSALLLQKQVFDGLFPAIVGTLCLVVLSVLLAVPLGVAAGIYMAEYAVGYVKTCCDFLFDILAGIPSIVIGLFGFTLAVFLHKNFSDQVYPCFLISSISLAFLVLPYIVRSTQISLEEIDPAIRNTALALGASRLQNIIHVLLPRALGGICSGVILAIGRCAEDTAVIMLTGAVAIAGIPRSILGQYEALPFYIFYISSQYADQAELMRGYGASLILIMLCTLLFLVAFLVRKRIAYQAFYKA